jgi:hypothetical protein
MERGSIDGGVDAIESIDNRTTGTASHTSASDNDNRALQNPSVCDASVDLTSSVLVDYVPPSPDKTESPVDQSSVVVMLEELYLESKSQPRKDQAVFADNVVPSNRLSAVLEEPRLQTIRSPHENSTQRNVLNHHDKKHDVTLDWHHKSVSDTGHPMQQVYLTESAFLSPTEQLVMPTRTSTEVEQGPTMLDHPNSSSLGAIAMFPSDYRHNPEAADDDRSYSPDDDFEASAITGNYDPVLNAFRVDEDAGVLANATIVNSEEEQRIKWRRQNLFGGIVLIATLSIAATLSVVYGRNRGGAFPVTLSPSISVSPSWIPSGSPSASPSTNLFSFLAARSADDGLALATSGSSQARAMAWVEEEAKLIFSSSFDYELLQYYVLMTLYYETGGGQWDRRERWGNEILNTVDTQLCYWEGVVCGDERAIVVLNLTNNRLLGSLPPELAILDPSLSKLIPCC